MLVLFVSINFIVSKVKMGEEKDNTQNKEKNPE